jgi:hypothetical protein
MSPWPVDQINQFGEHMVDKIQVAQLLYQGDPMSPSICKEMQIGMGLIQNNTM